VSAHGLCPTHEFAADRARATRRGLLVLAALRPPPILVPMSTPTEQSPTSVRLHCGIVLSVQEDACEILGRGKLASARFATPFPSPRTERVSPGHLVAVATARDGAEVVVWRWYDAVVLDQAQGQIWLWEPSHGRVAAQPRHPEQRYQPGTRAYLSAGLPGADWWLAGAAVARAEHADVELDEVERLYTEHDLWNHL